MKQQHRGEYPESWPTIALAVKKAAHWTCIRCGQVHDTKKRGAILSVHHLDCNKSNCVWWNCVALCQRCHLTVQAKVVMDRPWVMTEHTAWAKPYIAGHYAKKYLSLALDRPTTERYIDFLLDVERRVLNGERKSVLELEWGTLRYGPQTQPRSVALAGAPSRDDRPRDATPTDRFERGRDTATGQRDRQRRPAVEALVQPRRTTPPVRDDRR